MSWVVLFLCFFFQAEDGIRDRNVTGVQTCALPISLPCGREHPACDLGCPTWQHRSGLASGPQQYGSRWPCVEHARRSEEHTSELQSRFDLVCRLLLEKKKYPAYQHLKDFTFITYKL